MYSIFIKCYYTPMKLKNSIISVVTFCRPEFTHNDERGELKQIFSTGWSQANLINSIKESERGGHFHKNNNELFFIISGAFELTLEKDEKIHIINISKNDMFIIHKEVKHSFIFTEDTMLLAFYDKGVQKNSEIDIHKN